MKIAVLFGSFNPITNAHVALIKSAVQALGAKKGLLVATNDRYLRRKAIKHNHEFCLDEQERRQMIEDAFADTSWVAKILSVTRRFAK